MFCLTFTDYHSTNQTEQSEQPVDFYYEYQQGPLGNCITLKMDTVRIFETLATQPKSTQHHNPETGFTLIFNLRRFSPTYNLWYVNYFHLKLNHTQKLHQKIKLYQCTKLHVLHIGVWP
jgi:hypothetical protein